jgi:Asp-tRNA(Asn)/Glu-tRNA(Gln) amidotransferase A subunit family amidase
MAATVDELSAVGIARRIRAGELSCEEVVRSHLAVIAERDGAIRAFAALDEELALEAARALDALPREAAGALPLLGVPVAVKDVFDTADLPTLRSSSCSALPAR